MGAILEAADRTLRAVLVGTVSVMVAVVFAQVVARYGFNRSFGWADEIGRLAFVWSIFLGMAVAVRMRAHIAIGLLVGLLPGMLRFAARAAIALACAVLSAIVAREAAMIAADQWDEQMISLDLSAGWFLVPVIIGSAACALFFVAQAFARDEP
jgi:TRAP-type C4-dicarboxylate transport system permease small subunit